MRKLRLRVKKKYRTAFRLILFGGAMIIAIFLLDHRIRPLITTMATYQAQVLATRSINDAVISILDQQHLDYESLVGLSKDDQGEVTSLQTDMITINRLKSEITNKVTDQLTEDSSRPIYIPVGTLLGGNILSGRGPRVEFKILPAGYVRTEIYNQFTSAGINQTLHQVMLCVNAQVSAVIPVYTITTEVNTNICIAQTIIVGKVPGAFTDINGDSSDIIRQYNDYKATQ
ncbi:sporulation protein YunB [Youxingia wuxianensis]|uniref:Sporulation protein YunB n=1 Tax=Youxingia wuxianensis TaxID=2763678 RepID=A0A926EKL8_9FIRM|nr:sporulation protein YunB [Youxingia wuxianensis]MBC8585123.1 sporulation protein YunB [Youxingia wuxianensis]